MKRIALALIPVAAGLFFLVGAGTSGTRSGLRGTVLVVPGAPVCRTPSCSTPAAHIRLQFWRNGRVVARTRTDANGRFRVALRPMTYTVTSVGRGAVKPVRVSVATGSYRRMTFKLDIGIR